MTDFLTFLADGRYISRYRFLRRVERRGVVYSATVAAFKRFTLGPK